jgi:hypothetical protein|tara:strand:- start:596 stop:937 length:342 start_codon:yes stop_codon:yes gene_type:complete
MENYIDQSDYTYVENDSAEFWGIKFRNDSPYSGVVVVYGTVSIKESEELEMATLSFTYNVQDAGPRNIDELESSEEFKNYLGDVLSSIINDQAKETNGHNKSITDSYTESSSQ